MAGGVAREARGELNYLLILPFRFAWLPVHPVHKTQNTCSAVSERRPAPFAASVRSSDGCFKMQ
jgi:hypothetical protein